MTNICVANLTIIDSDNDLSPGRHQAIIWTNDGILLIGLLGTHFSEVLIKIHTASFRKKHLKLSSAEWQPFCLSLNELMKLSDRQWISVSAVQADMANWNQHKCELILPVHKCPFHPNPPQIRNPCCPDPVPSWETWRAPFCDNWYNPYSWNNFKQWSGRLFG